MRPRKELRTIHSVTVCQIDWQSAVFVDPYALIDYHPPKPIAVPTSFDEKQFYFPDCLMNIDGLQKFLRRNDTDYFRAIASGIRFLSNRANGRNLLEYGLCEIAGRDRMLVNGIMHIGDPIGNFVSKDDRTVVKILGQLVVNGNVHIARGCRVLIHENAKCEIQSSYINVHTKLIIKHHLFIGSGTAISWNCEFLDHDGHQILYHGEKRKSNQGIYIGEHVLIGSGCKILKGVSIGNNNIIAANSVVTKSIADENCLIAGNPAVVIRKGYTWA